jgi:hypothetical protein
VTWVPAAFDADDERLRERARFHGRCALLEDLAFGIEHERPLYTDKSLAGLSWMFASAL